MEREPIYPERKSSQSVDTVISIVKLLSLTLLAIGAFILYKSIENNNNVAIGICLTVSAFLAFLFLKILIGFKEIVISAENTNAYYKHIFEIQEKIENKE